MLSRLTLAACATMLASPAMAQDLLSRAEVEAHLQDSVFCYYPSDRTACSWAEIYTIFEADHTILYSASAVWEEPMEVIEFRIDWRDDALCVPAENQGIQAVWYAEGYRFPFDLQGLDPGSEDNVAELVVEFSEGAPQDFCFRYSSDPDVPGQLLQHVYRDGVEDEERDPVALIPRWASGVAINPSG